MKQAQSNALPAGTAMQPGRRFSSTVARMIVRCLKAEGVSTVFVVPGGPIMPFIDALFLASGLRVVMARHETGAGFMSDGYQRVAGGLAVCVTTAGPGATNAITATACALADGTPMLVISGQPGLSAFGKNPVQDSSSLGVDTVELFRSVTKKSLLLNEPAAAAGTVQHLIRLAFAGRPGPVHLAVPADLLGRRTSGQVQPPAAYRALGRPLDLSAIERAARLLVDCRQPVILAGNGVRSAGAQAELAALASLLGAPVATTGKAKGVMNEATPLSLRVFGFAGSRVADDVIFDRRTDCLLVVGSSLGELASHAWDARLSKKKIIQVDIEPARIANSYGVEVGIVGDAREVLAELGRRLVRLPRRPAYRPRRTRPLSIHGAAPQTHCVAYDKLSDDTPPLTPQRVVGELGRVLSADTTLFLDIGACMAFALHYLVVRNPNGFHINLGFASMGHGVAAVIGGQLARPAHKHICLCGDGAFMMNGTEVHTAVEAGASCTWLILNNSGQSSVRSGVLHQFGSRGRRAGLLRMTRFTHPVDCAGMAEAMGALAFRVRSAAELGPALRQAIAAPRPAVVDAYVDIDEEPPLGMRLALLDKFFDRKR